MQVRAALGTTTNVNTGLGTISSVGVEIQKRIDEMVVQAYNSEVDFSKMLRRVSIPQLAYIWNVAKENATDSGLGLVSGAAGFYSEGGAVVPATSAKAQLVAIGKSYRADYAITGLMAASAMPGQGMDYEASAAAKDLAVLEERQIIGGSNDEDAYGDSLGFQGLRDLVWYSDASLVGSTTAKHGLANSATYRAYLNTQWVLAAAANALDSLTLADLDSAITASDNRGGRGHRRIFLCSNERRDEIDQLLQSQQRFVAPSVEIEGGFRVSSYKGIPIIGSRFMDKNGVKWTGTTSADITTFYTDADNAMYLLDLDFMMMVHVAGVNAVHVPIGGGNVTAADNTTFSGRADEVGGYFKSYGAFVMKRFDTSVLISNLTAPA